MNAAYDNNGVKQFKEFEDINCKHEFEWRLYKDDVKRKTCKKCNLIAHSDYNYSYKCGDGYCRCIS